uniref:PH domain-containing protein n=1 Tax=Timspurckia oligopyrenoides TaxID=708627 RepID=A0A6T6NSW7_9RHOD|mmetsp:Transcript_9462/g.17081  ORF Transcript_9462/g.17081 Transcript_9462/m.17081 type:complete len:211 (-) Transcript_9462:73-705(-)
MDLVEKKNSIEEMLSGEVVVSLCYCSGSWDSRYVEDRPSGFTSPDIMVSIQKKGSRSFTEKLGSSKHFQKRNVHLRDGCLTVFEDGRSSTFSCELAGASIKRCTRFHVMTITLPGKESYILMLRFPDSVICDTWNEMIQRAVTRPILKQSNSLSQDMFSSGDRRSTEEVKRWQYLVSNSSIEKDLNISSCIRSTSSSSFGSGQYSQIAAA